MAELDSQQDKGLAPSLMLGSRGGRYPNQFFDLAQQYMPPTIKELFRWCTFYYYNSPLIGSSITKVSRYPITDLIFEDEKDSVREVWSKIFNRDLKIKDQLMEINLDYHVYGNAFISVHLPFTRFLVCKLCHNSEPISQWKWDFNASTFGFRGTCKKCKEQGDLDVRDVPYKDRKSVRIIRWNPENISVKYNEYTGKRIYMYSVPYKLKNAIQRGDRDILEDIPLIVLQALRTRRMIRFNNDNFKHIRRPTLAEQDQGWGKPLIIHVLKDMFYLYTLRRAQEAIALEHIVPFDLIYPMPNAQADPYIHTNLANWRVQLETVITKHRRDPNFKAVIPIPVGFGRLGGDGKAMMLTPELNYLTQTIVGGMGIPQEFLFGGLNFTGSSISLRTLENDFIQNRSQLLDIVLWLKDKLRLWLSLPDIKSMRFSDFRMADDVQRNQQLIGLNAASKVSDQTMLTELGYDWEQEQRKMIEEVQFQNYLNDLRAKGSAKTQGEAGLIQFNYQTKVQELAAQAQQTTNDRIMAMGGDPNAQGVGTQPGQPGGKQDGQGTPGGMPTNQGAGAIGDPQGAKDDVAVGGGAPAAGGAPWQNMAQSDLAGNGAQGQPGQPPQALPTASPNELVDSDIQKRVKKWAKQLTQIDPAQAQQSLNELKTKLPDIGRMVEMAYNAEKVKGTQAQAKTPSGNKSKAGQPTAMPTRKAPTGKGSGLV